MLEIKESVGSVVAADTQSTIAALDHALAQQARMCASLVEAAQDSGLAIAITQPIFESVTAGMRGLVDGRAHMADAAREIAKIQGRSNLRETAFGCPNGLAPRGHHAETVEA